MLAGGAGSLPTPTGGGGGGVNVTVTDVAWSLPQSYVVDYGIASQGDNLFTDGVGSSGSDGNLVEAHDSTNAIDVEHHPWHYPPFIKRVHAGNTSATARIDDTSVVAAAGSNGVVVAWHAHSALLGDHSSSSNSSSQSGLFHARRGRAGENNTATNASSVSSAASIGQPEAVFLGHSRAVNRLAWHPTGHRPYLLLSASQDGTVKLWDRRASTSNNNGGGMGPKGSPSASVPQPIISWFGLGGTQLQSNNTKLQVSNAPSRTAAWHCVSTFQPKCEAVRDIKWSPSVDDLFAMVTDNGMLCVYDVRLNRPMIKESAHAGEATTVDWHPTRKYTVATGGGRDRSVKGTLFDLCFRPSCCCYC